MRSEGRHATRPCLLGLRRSRHPSVSRRLSTLTSHALARWLLSDLQRHHHFSTMSGTVSKITAERNQKALMELAMRPGNGECCLYPIRRMLVAFILPLRPGPAKIP
jgi:hypothetical protein